MIRAKRDRLLAAVSAGAVLVGVLTVSPHGSAALSAPASAIGADDGIALDIEDEAFWEGSVGGPTAIADACDLEVELDASCVEFPITVAAGGDRLRVGLDRPSGYGAELTLSLLDPSGVARETTDDRVRDAAQQASGFQSFELFVDAPEGGTWTARVTNRSAGSSTFRMRAKLEEAPAEVGNGRDNRVAKRLLPNLRPTPPFELTFKGPDPASINGCRQDEIAEAGARVCLRFSAGPLNVGEGPLDLLYDGAGQLEGTITQRIHRTDGTVEEVPGGTFHYHLNHAHYHHDSIGGNELLRVAPDGSLTQVSSTPKTGYCMGDYLIADWTSFSNSPPRTYDEQAQSCGLTGPLGANLGLATGWGDIYGWATPGNYVEFDGAGDGEYVVRMASNDDGNIVESDHTDNIAYTHFRVEGTTITVLERGIGLGPADPHKQVVRDDNRLGVAL